MVSLPLPYSGEQTLIPIDRKPWGRHAAPGGTMSFATGLKTIVVATELKGRSEAALEYARKIATAYGARLVLAHGADPVEYAAVDTIPGRVLTELPEETRTVLESLSAELLREGIHTTRRSARARSPRCFWMWRGSMRLG